MYTDISQVNFLVVRSKAVELLGMPIGEGSERLVFRLGNHVVKIPTKESGISANECELYTQGPRLAVTSENHTLGEYLGVLVINMEYVTHTGFSEKSDWTWGIDCGQVGRNAKGRLVAYDFG